MDAPVERRLAAERGRTSRALFWLGAVFFLVLLLSLAVFMAVSFFALRNAAETRRIAYETDARTAAFASDIIGAQARADKVEADQLNMREALDETRGDVKREGEQWRMEVAKLRELFESRRETEGSAIAGMATGIKVLADGAAARDAALAALADEVQGLATALLARAETAPAGAPAGPDAAAAAQPPAARRSPGEAVVTEDAPEPAAADAGEEEIREVAVMTFPNGDRYEGEFEDGLFNGEGTYYYANGDRYDGEFRDDMKHGRGILKFANGDQYNGEFANDRMNGAGTMIYASRNKYVGEFRNGMRLGRGVLTFPNGDRYEGEFQDDVRQGRGTYSFSDGSVYAGEFKNGRRDGKGRYVYPDGSVYDGEFKDGRKHGYAECIYPGGELIKGYWADDRFERAAE